MEQGAQLLTRRDYLNVLQALEVQLRRHSGAGQALLLLGNEHRLREAWERMAQDFREDYPGEDVPIPFWERAEAPADG